MADSGSRPIRYAEFQVGADPFGMVRRIGEATRDRIRGFVATGVEGVAYRILAAALLPHRRLGPSRPEGAETGPGVER